MLDEGAITVQKDRRAAIQRLSTVPSLEDHGRVVLGSLERLMSPNVQMISSPDPTAHSAHNPRNNLKSKVKCAHPGDFAESRRIDDIHTGVGQITGWLLRLFDE